MAALKTNVNLVTGKFGIILKVNGLYIHRSFTGEIKAIEDKGGIPHGSTEWASISAMREFWHAYMALIIHATKQPYSSINGNLVANH